MSQQPTKSPNPLSLKERMKVPRQPMPEQPDAIPERIVHRHVARQQLEIRRTRFERADLGHAARRVETHQADIGAHVDHPVAVRQHRVEELQRARLEAGLDEQRALVGRAGVVRAGDAEFTCC
jgi:hypothetical protein